MDDAADSYIDIAKAVWQQIEKIPQRTRDDKRIFDSFDPTLSRVLLTD